MTLCKQFNLGSFDNCQTMCVQDIKIQYREGKMAFENTMPSSTSNAEKLSLEMGRLE